MSHMKRIYGMKDRPLVHIGMAKAASTFMQLEIFPNLSSIYNLGKHNVSTDLTSAGRALTRRISLDWNEEKFGTPFQTAIQAAKKQQLRALYSEEDLSVFKFLDPETMARRVRSIFGEYDVLLIIREPQSWVRSQYLFRLQTLNEVATLGFDYWLATHFKSRHIGSDVCEIWFADVALLFQKICGGRVHILPYELLKTDKSLFAHAAAEIICADPIEIQDILDSQESGRKYKQSIGSQSQNFYEIFRWIVFNNHDRAKSCIFSYFDEMNVTIPIHIVDEMNKLALNGNNRQKWKELFKELGNYIPSESERCEPIIPEEYQEKLNKIKHNQLNKLKVKFDFSLEDFELCY